MRMINLISNRVAYTFIAIGILVAIAFAVNAYNYPDGPPSEMGHTMGELNPPASCTGTQTLLSYSGGAWNCIDPPASSSSESYWARDVANGEIYPLTLTDQVGIGTTDPGYNLDVNGNVRVYGPIYISGSQGTSTIKQNPSLEFISSNGIINMWGNWGAGSGYHKLVIGDLQLVKSSGMYETGNALIGGDVAVGGAIKSSTGDVIIQLG